MTINQLAVTLAPVVPAKHYAAITDLFQVANRFVSIAGPTVANLNQAAWPTGSGVYVVRKHTTGEVLYIGKTGKLKGVDGAPAIMNGGSLVQRLQRWTPYCFQSAGPYADHFEYGPNFGVNDISKQPFAVRYRIHVPLVQITTDCFSTAGIEHQLSPALLEALLLQDYVSRYGALPPGNQEF